MEKQDILNRISSLNKVSKESKIAVIMGGKSAEREVSLKSGENCLNALLKLGYINSISIDMDDNIAYALMEQGIDIAFIMLHGTYGEDGYIQSILEQLNIPYTGCGIESSQLCINKEKTKEVLKRSNIPCPKTITLADKDIKYPVFCKPVDQGSSIGAGLANNKEELDKIIKEISKHSHNPPLIEEYIKGRELTVGVLQIENEVFATDILEIEVKDGEYDYDNKYTAGALIHTAPAKIDKNLTEQIKSHTISAFKFANCRGFTRVDVLLNGKDPYIIEINTIPGMTNLSDLPCQAKSFGISYENLVNLMLHSALIK